ncbi:MAG: NUDIX hydrolase [Candidatus Neomarinimicrobiota bacterium]
MGRLTYCSNCGARNEVRTVEGRRRRICPQCGTVHYENPLPAATIVAVQDGRLLLIRRGVAPRKGHWSLPGGFMELRESAEEAARRELAEETGLVAEGLRLLGVCPFAGGIRGEVLVLGFACDVFSGELAPGDDALDARFFPLDELPSVAFRCHREMIRMYLEHEPVPDGALQDVGAPPGGP